MTTANPMFVIWDTAANLAAIFNVAPQRIRRLAQFAAIRMQYRGETPVFSAVDLQTYTEFERQRDAGVLGHMTFQEFKTQHEGQASYDG